MYGVLYQLLTSLDRVLSATIEQPRVRSEELTSAQLVLEPLNGGDLRSTTTRARVVEQYKTRRNRAWPLQALLKDVLPDLYRAVPSTSSSLNHEYRFVTNARLGNWGSFLAFCKELKGIPAHEVPGGLDDSETVCRLRQKPLSRRQLFLAALERLQRRPTHQDDYATTCAKLHHLLAHFDVAAARAEDALLREINGVLRPLLDDPDTLDEKRDALLGWLLKRASKGSFQLTPEELLKHAHLQGTPTTAIAQARADLHEDVQRTATQELGYDASQDVRGPINWPRGKRVLVFSGESGQGKTWRLARTILQSRMALPVLLGSRGDFERDLQAASDKGWHVGFKRFTRLTLHQLRERLHQDHTPVPDPWLVIGIDDIQDAPSARRLVHECLALPGVHIALTTNPRIAASLASRHPERVHCDFVADFTPRELREYLERRGRTWSAIPRDVRSTLARPLLAKLYADLAVEEHWNPTSEYELYEKYWERLRHDHEGPDHPQDPKRLKRLARATRLDPSQYPWALSQLEQARLDEAACMRLERTGWLRTAREDHYALPHDRLLSWLVARTFADDLQDHGAIGAPDVLEDFVQNYWLSTGAPRWRAYVAMDTLWMLCEEAPSTAAHVIAAMDQHSRAHTALYEELLPTLGLRVITPLRERLESASEERLYPTQPARTLIRVLQRAPREAREQLHGLLASDSTLCVDTALLTLASQPTASALNRLWVLHQESTRALHDETDSRRFIRYDYTINALKACARERPAWVSERINHADPTQEPLGELAYVLASLGPGGLEVWNLTRTTLIKNTREHSPRGALTCLRVFKDDSELPWLRECLTSNKPLVQHTAFGALARISPEAALEALRAFSSRALSTFANWWLPELFLQHREHTQAQLLALLRGATSDVWSVASIFSNHMNAITTNMLDELLSRLALELKACANKPEQAQRDQLRRPLMFLSRVHRIDLLATLEKQQGTPLEDNLARIAIEWLPDKTTRILDHDLERAREVLEKIAGPGIQNFVTAQLECACVLHRIDALERLPASPPARALHLIKERVARWTAQSDQYAHLELQRSLRALALLGDLDTIAHTTLQEGAPAPLLETPYWRDPQARLSGTALEQALSAARSEDDDTVLRGLCALYACDEENALAALAQVLARGPLNERLETLTRQLLALTSERDPVRAQTICEKVPLAPQDAFPIQVRIAAGDAKSLSEARDHLLAHKDTLAAQLREEAAWLATHLRDFELAARVVWPGARNDSIHSYAPSTFSAIALLEDEQAHAWLCEHAVSSDTRILWDGLPTRFYAAEALLDRDRALALQAITAALREDAQHVLAHARLLVTHARSESTAPLVELAFRSDTPVSTVRDIALALREVDSTLKSPSIRRALNDGQADSVLARACLLAGWQGPGFLADELRALALASASDRVREAAIEALDIQCTLAHAQDLLGAIPSAHGQAQWNFVASLIAICEPAILRHPSDPLALAPVWQALSTPLRHYGQALLEKRAKEVERENRSKDRANP